MRLKLLAVVLLFAIGVGAAGFVVFGPTLGSTDGSRFITAAAAREDVIASAVATGSVGPSATYGLAFGRDPAIAGSSSSSSSSSNGTGGSTTWTVTRVDVVVGDNVTKGEVLAAADADDAQLQLSIAQANLATAEAKLTEDEAGITKADRAVAQDQVNQASHQLAVARQGYTDTVRQNNLSITAAKQAVAQANAQLAADRKSHQPADVIARDQTAVTNAKTNLSQTRARATASNHQASSSVSAASLSLTSARNAYTSRVAGTPDAQLAQDRASVATAQSQLATAQKTVDGASITAPTDGVVTAVAIVPGIAAPSGDAIEVEAGPMQVTASFAEADLASLKAGQDAVVSISATADSVDGTVASIDPVAANSGTSSVVTYSVTVTLKDAPPVVKTGMSADVSVTTASATGVIAVPSIALGGATGAYTVRVVDGSGQAEVRSVEVGLTTSSLAEITSGLNEGETVVIGSASDRQGTNNGLGGLGGGALGGGGLGGGNGRFNGGGAGNGGVVTQGGGQP